MALLLSHSPACLGLLACFNAPVPVPNSPRQALAASREVQGLVAREVQISRLSLAMSALALAQATSNLITAERGLGRLLHLLTLLVYRKVFGELLLRVTVHQHSSLCITTMTMFSR